MSANVTVTRTSVTIRCEIVTFTRAIVTFFETIVTMARTAVTFPRTIVTFRRTNVTPARHNVTLTRPAASSRDERDSEMGDLRSSLFVDAGRAQRDLEEGRARRDGVPEQVPGVRRPRERHRACARDVGEVAPPEVIHLTGIGEEPQLAAGARRELGRGEHCAGVEDVVAQRVGALREGEGVAGGGPERLAAGGARDAAVGEDARPVGEDAADVGHDVVGRGGAEPPDLVRVRRGPRSPPAPPCRAAESNPPVEGNSASCVPRSVMAAQVPLDAPIFTADLVEVRVALEHEEPSALEVAAVEVPRRRATGCRGSPRPCARGPSPRRTRSAGRCTPTPCPRRRCSPRTRPQPRARRRRRRS